MKVLYTIDETNKTMENQAAKLVSETLEVDLEEITVAIGTEGEGQERMDLDDPEQETEIPKSSKGKDQPASEDDHQSPEREREAVPSFVSVARDQPIQGKEPLQAEESDKGQKKKTPHADQTIRKVKANARMPSGSGRRTTGRNDLRRVLDRCVRPPVLARRIQQSGPVPRGEPGYRFLLPARKARTVMQEWNMASATQIKRGSSTVLFDINASPNAVVTVKNRHRREAIRLLLEITEIAFRTTVRKQVRLLLYTEDIHDLHVFRRRRLHTFRGRQTEDDVYTYTHYAPASDERMVKVTGSMDEVAFRTREILGAVTFQAMRPKHRHYTPNQQ